MLNTPTIDQVLEQEMNWSKNRSVEEILDRDWEWPILLSIVLAEHPSNPIDLSKIPGCSIFPGDEIRFRRIQIPDAGSQNQLSQAWSLPRPGKVTTFLLGDNQELVEIRPMKPDRILWLDLTIARRTMKRDVCSKATPQFLVVLREHAGRSIIIVTLVCLDSVSQKTRYWRFPGLEHIGKDQDQRLQPALA